jgi:hypothetical protein
VLSKVAIDLKEWDIAEVWGSNLNYISAILCKTATDCGTGDDAAKLQNTNARQDLWFWCP